MALQLQTAKYLRDQANKAYVYAKPEHAEKAWRDLHEANWFLLEAIMAAFPKENGQTELPL